MIYRFLADGVVVFHGAFIIFSILGALLALRWRKVIWFHIPAAAWAVIVQTPLMGGVCPLTPLENYFRDKGHEAGIGDSFIDHYLTDLIYLDSPPEWLHPALGAGVGLVNLQVYTLLLLRIFRPEAFRRLARHPIVCGALAALLCTNLLLLIGLLGVFRFGLVLVLGMVVGGIMRTRRRTPTEAWGAAAFSLAASLVVVCCYWGMRLAYMPARDHWDLLGWEGEVTFGRVVGRVLTDPGLLMVCFGSALLAWLTVHVVNRREGVLMAEAGGFEVAADAAGGPEPAPRPVTPAARAVAQHEAAGK